MRRPSNPSNPLPAAAPKKRKKNHQPKSMRTPTVEELNGLGFPRNSVLPPEPEEDDCDRAMHALFDTLRDWRKNPKSDLNQRGLAAAWDKYQLELGKVVDEEIRQEELARGITDSSGAD